VGESQLVRYLGTAELTPDARTTFPSSRTVCLTEETVETLYLLGEQDRLVGVSGYAVGPPQASTPAGRFAQIAAIHSASVNFLRILSRTVRSTST
jgi:ABC-type hemin transport system substrate-binding protein